MLGGEIVMLHSLVRAQTSLRHGFVCCKFLKRVVIESCDQICYPDSINFCRCLKHEATNLAMMLVRC